VPEAVPGLPTQADGSLAPTAAEAEGLIGEALALDAVQPLALHLHIHLAEASSPMRSARAPCMPSRAWTPYWDVCRLMLSICAGPAGFRLQNEPSQRMTT